MGKGFPFFHYDILARIVPGALTLAVLIFAGVEIPDRLLDMLKSEKGWNPVITPIVFVGASYGIGVLYEVFFALKRITYISDWIVKSAFASAYRQKYDVLDPKKNPQKLAKYARDLCHHVKEYEVRSERREIDKQLNELARVMAENPLWPKRHEISGRLKTLTDASRGTSSSVLLEGITDRLDEAISQKLETTGLTQELNRELTKCAHAWRFDLHNWVVHRGIGDKAPILAHVHRFQAEARMCLHSFLPACCFAYLAWDEGCIGFDCKQQVACLVATVLSLLLLGCGAYWREWRRWVQVFNATEYLD